MKRVQILKRKKGEILLWFRYYQLCLQDKKLSKNLKTSEQLYKPWGKITKSTKFNDWWEKNKYLFDEVRIIDSIIKRPSLLNISIPLDQSVTKTLDDVKIIIEEQQEVRFKKLNKGMTQKEHNKQMRELRKKLSIKYNRKEEDILGISQVKSKKPRLIENKQGREFDTDRHYDVLLVMEFWIQKGRPKISVKFMDQLSDFYDKSKRRKPFQIQSKRTVIDRISGSWDQLQMRTIRGYTKGGSQILENVSKGIFPGPYSLR